MNQISMALYYVHLHQLVYIQTVEGQRLSIIYTYMHESQSRLVSPKVSPSHISTYMQAQIMFASIDRMKHV